MAKKKINRERKKKFNIFFKIMASISTLITLIFCILLSVLDMLPLKYLLIIYGVILLIYVLCIFLTFVDKIKVKIKLVCLFFFLLFGVICGIGIKYLSDTIGFVNVFGDELLQKEEYYVMVPSDYTSENIESLQKKHIGIYDNINTDKVIEKLSKKIEFNEKNYKNVLDMFEDLEKEEISAVIINNSIKNLLDTELKDMHFEIKQIHTFTITIKKVETVKVVDVINTPFNIYIAGGDAYGDIGNVTNTDVNMIATVDPVNKKILLTSVPRDYYVNLPSFGEDVYDKLTHAGYYGIEESILAIEELLDTEINYYVKVNFSTIEGIIDAIGGIDVYSDYTFYEQGFGIYTFKKGYNHLNGHQALAFARERKAFADGDVQRVKNQQKVLEAIISKATSSTAIITNFSEILDSVSSNFSTNIDSKSISRLVKMQLNQMSTWNIESQNLTGTDYYTSETYTFNGTNLYVMKRNEESVTNGIKNIKSYLNK